MIEKLLHNDKEVCRTSSKLCRCLRLKYKNGDCCGYTGQWKRLRTYDRFDRIPTCDGQTDGQYCDSRGLVRAIHRPVKQLYQTLWQYFDRNEFSSNTSREKRKHGDLRRCDQYLSLSRKWYKRAYTNNGRPIESQNVYGRCHFQWPWATPNPVFKITPFFDAEIWIYHKQLKIRPYCYKMRIGNCTQAFEWYRFYDLEWHT